MNNDESTEQGKSAGPDARPQINQFLAKDALLKADAQKQLKVSASITCDIDDVEELGARKGLPSQYAATADGIYITRGKNSVPVCSTPLMPYAIQCGVDRQSQVGVNLVGVNNFGEPVYFSVSLKDLAGKAADDLISDLAYKGVFVGNSPQEKSRFSTFVQQCGKMALPRYLVAESTGFVPGHAAFLHGKEPISAGLDGFDYLVPGRKIHDGLCASGSIEEWRTLIKDNVRGWSQKFALSASFASMLLPLVSMDIGMFHFFGGSTTGKTLILQLAMSVHGNGAEPGSGPDAAIIRWNNTANALERFLGNFSGLVACIDEISAYQGKDIDSLLYNITAGVSKGRMNKDTSSRTPITWRNLVLSSGESSIPQVLSKEKKMLQGGQEHRAISLQVLAEDAAMPDEDKESIRTRFAALKTGLAECYGTSGKEFIRYLLSQIGEGSAAISFEALAMQMTGYLDDYLASLQDELKSDGYTVSNIQHRGLKRFALCALAGELAIEWEILPFDEGDAYGATLDAARCWLKNSSNQFNPALQALDKIHQNLLSQQGGHFIKHDEKSGYLPNTVWGMTDRHGDFFVFEGTFRKWCTDNGSDAVTIASKLLDKSYLVPESSSHYKKRRRYSDEQTYVYHIKKSFLSISVTDEF